eukprot:3351801-Pyramimonas_sp.AAC.1
MPWCLIELEGCTNNHLQNGVSPEWQAHWALVIEGGRFPQWKGILVGTSEGELGTGRCIAAPRTHP